MNLSKKSKFSVIGAGSWGTAIACMITHSIGACDLFSLEQCSVDEINIEKTNTKYLDNCSMPKGLVATNDFKQVLTADVIIIAAPSFAFESVLTNLKQNNLSEDKIILIASKGLCSNPIQLFSEKFEQDFNNVYGFISGPNFAKEVAQNKFASITITSKNIQMAQEIADILARDNLEISTANDVITVQIAGIVKNIIAIRSGIMQARGGGENAKAWLISKGLQEISDISCALGGDIQSLYLPAVVGDLALTSYSTTSRNTKFGIDYHNSNYSKELLHNYPMLVEGANSARLISHYIKKHNLNVPIISSIIDIV